MCGFAGFVGAPDAALLQRLGNCVQHRGPDQAGRYESDACSLIHQRLAIIDLSLAGRQPLKTADGRFVLAYNGEIYNYQELRQRYAAAGWKFATETDSECLLASMSLHGLGDIQDFHGMFAFAIWDARQRCVYLCRDRLGIKPLFVAEPAIAAGRFAFASEISALLELRPNWELNRRARASYFSVGYVPGPETMYQGIRSLEPGRIYRYQRQACEPWLDFSATKIATPTMISWPAAQQRLRGLVDGAVKRQLISERPIGVFLSGGLDSSVVLSAMRQARGNQRIKTFTTRFAHHTADQKFNRDADIARETAARYGCERQEIEVGPASVIDMAPRLARTLAQPHQNHSVVALDAAARLAAQDVTVVLSGDGGDESFGGYERYRLYGLAAPWLRRPAVRRGLFALLKSQPRAARWRDLLSATTEAERCLFFHAASQSLRRSLVGEAMDDQIVREAFEKKLAGIPMTDPVSRFMALDRLTWLRDDAFVRSDRITMRYGLELRVPLTDDAVVDFAASLPRRFHVTSRATKRLWRSAFADRCLPSVLHEPKRGWFPPTSKWLRQGLTDWARDLLEEAIRDHDWLQAEALRRCFQDHLDGRAYRLNELWLILGYQLWWREYRHKLID